MAKEAEKSKEKTVSETKNTVPKGQKTPPEAAIVSLPAELLPPGPVPESPPEAQETRKQYAFPKVNPCPRCHATDTLQTSTQENIQYRQCQRPICRETFKVIGTEVVFTDNKQGG